MHVHAYTSSFSVILICTGRSVQTHAHNALIAHTHIFRDAEMHRQDCLNTSDLSMNGYTREPISANVYVHVHTQICSRHPFPVLLKYAEIYIRKTHTQSLFLVAKNTGRPVQTHAHTHTHAYTNTFFVKMKASLNTRTHTYTYTNAFFVMIKSIGRPV